MMTRAIDTTQGYVHYRRQRYRCHKCLRWYYPVDLELELNPKAAMSRRKEDQLTQLSVTMSFGESKKIYEKLTGRKAAKSTIHRTAQRTGENALSRRPDYSIDRSKQRAQKKEENLKRHVGSDGVMIYVVGEGWKEAKVGVCYDINEHKEVIESHYTATLGAREDMGKWLYRSSGAPLPEQTESLAFLADAASWLDDMKDVHFPNATRILDFYHAGEYLGNLGKAFYENNPHHQTVWIQKKLKDLKEGKHQKVLGNFKQMKPKDKQQKKCLQDAKRYFTNHGKHMNYPEYEKKGFHIGSGIIEAACKNVVQARFKRSGMRWSREGAERVLYLRTLYLNSEWETFQPRAA